MISVDRESRGDSLVIFLQFLHPGGNFPSPGARQVTGPIIRWSVVPVSQVRTVSWKHNKFPRFGAETGKVPFYKQHVQIRKGQTKAPWDLDTEIDTGDLEISTIQPSKCVRNHVEMHQTLASKRTSTNGNLVDSTDSPRMVGLQGTFLRCLSFLPSVRWFQDSPWSAGMRYSTGKHQNLSGSCWSHMACSSLATPIPLWWNRHLDSNPFTKLMGRLLRLMVGFRKTLKKTWKSANSASAGS